MTVNETRSMGNRPNRAHLFIEGLVCKTSTEDDTRIIVRSIRRSTSRAGLEILRLYGLLHEVTTTRTNSGPMTVAAGLSDASNPPVRLTG